MNGAAEDDVFEGLAGNDEIHGGDGSDDLFGGQGADKLYGDAGDDTLDGGDGDDILDGGAGQDFYRGGPGNDIMIGRVGDNDMVSYHYASGGVTVDLRITTAQNIGADQGSDTLQNIIFLLGSSYADTLTGGAANEAIRGAGGNDRIDGGDGFDYVYYDTASGPVTVDLSLTGPQATGGDGVDTLLNIEGVNGSPFNDVLTGNSAGNGLFGGFGDDTLTGGGGNDLIDGGSGYDIAVYSGASANYTRVKNADNSWTVTDTRPGSPDGPDTLKEVEALKFSDTTIEIATAPNRVSIRPYDLIASEGSGAGSPTVMTFQVVRSGNLSATASVTYAVGPYASNPYYATPDDFVGGVYPTGTVAFAAGEAIKTITVEIVRDNLSEPDEVFSVTLTNPVGASFFSSAVEGSDTATGKILNDDGNSYPSWTANEVNAAFVNIMRHAAGSVGATAAAENALIQTTVQGLAGGALSTPAAIDRVVDYAISTTQVAVLAYQFFTGATLIGAGLDYLISPTGPNPNNLNSAYYQNFNLENRYINFASNLGKVGAAAPNFTAQYGSLTLLQSVTKAYTEIFGKAPDAATAAGLLSASIPLAGGGSYTRADYFASYGLDGPNGIGTKAAMVGWLLAEAAKANIGTYALASEAFLTDLADGAFLAGPVLGPDIISIYGLESYRLA